MRTVRQHGRDALPLSVPQLALDKGGADDVYWTCAAPGADWAATDRASGVNVSFWIRATEIGSTRGAIFRLHATTSAILLFRFTSSTVLQFSPINTIPAGRLLNYTHGATMLDGEWRHVCAQARNAATTGIDMWLTVDGSQVSALADGPNPLQTEAPTSVDLMYQPGVANTQTVGSIADLRFESGRLWTSDECAALRQQGPQSRATLGTIDAWLPDPLQGQTIGASTWAQAGTPGVALANLAISHAALRK